MKGIVRKTVPFLLIAVVIALLLFLPKKNEERKAVSPSIVEVWNVDTFEGGKGSRTSFLSKIARKTASEGVYYYILNYTAEGVKEAFSRGVCPDMISFGIGTDGIAERAIDLSKPSWGGELGGKCLAVPWCMGKYYRFSLSDDFSEEGRTAISCGGENLSVLAAKLDGIEGEELPSEEAYIRFLNGEFCYLLGTQRDVCRFQAREVTVYREELSEYDDLYQYVSVLSREKRELCLPLVEALLSEETRGSLKEIGMFSPAEGSASLTLSVFASAEARKELASLARAGREANFLEKYLKSR